MKIAITSKGKNLDSKVNSKFEEAPYILIVDTFSLGVEILDNDNHSTSIKGLTSIQAATQISEKGAQVLLTGSCEPNIYKTLNASGIRVANNLNGTVREAVIAFNTGRISYSKGLNKDT